MRSSPETIPQAYQTDKALADAYKDGWFVAAHFERTAKIQFDCEALLIGLIGPDRDWHRDVWARIVSDCKSHFRFESSELSLAFDHGALDAIEAGLAAYTDADYLGSDR
jgi:hypothetical protein